MKIIILGRKNMKKLTYEAGLAELQAVISQIESEN